MSISIRHGSIVTLLFALLCMHAAAQVVPATLVVQEGMRINVSGGRKLFTLPVGPVRVAGDVIAAVGTLTQGLERVIWTGNPQLGQTSVLLESDVGVSFDLSGLGHAPYGSAGATSGSSGRIAVTATLPNGDHGLLTHNGLILRDGDPIPGAPNAIATSSLAIDTLPSGNVYWLARFALTTGGFGTALLRSQQGTAAGIGIVLATGQTMAEGTISSLSGYSISDNESHHSQKLTIRNGGLFTTGIYVDGDVAYLRGQPITPRSSEAFQNFGALAINDDGDLAFGATTTAATNSNGVLVVNGRVRMREGQTFDGVNLLNHAEPTHVRFGPDGRLVSVWGIAGVNGPYAVFVTRDFENFSTTSVLLREGSLLDFDGDGIQDALLHTFSFRPNTVVAGATGVFLSVNLTYSDGNRRRAIVFLPYPS